MRILAIETSCDETAVAIVDAQRNEEDAEFRVLGNALFSQVELHQPYGGVYPTLAKREHIKNLPIMLERALAQAKLAVADVDVIAVTAGPGLEPALWTGIEFAKKLAAEHGKPLVAVNHMEGHVLAALAEKSAVNSRQSTVLEIKEVQLPVLALLISGGHTELVLMKEWLKYELIGQTLDDAVGEAFDKVARMLGLPYPGGPEISKLAEERRRDHADRSRVGTVSERDEDQHVETPLKLPRPMINDGTCNFSFAGLKTAVLYLLKDNVLINGRPAEDKYTSKEMKSKIAHEFENAVTDVLWKKTAKALEQTGAQTLVIGGGVSANTHIRRVFTENIAEYSDVTLRIPTAALTTDNAIMIALAGYYRALRGEFATDIKADGNLSLAQ